MSEQKTKVLLIDDEQAIVSILGRILKIAGFEVTTAMDGEEGLAKAREILPDVIVLDLMLPKLNGFDVCKAVKEDASTRKARVLIYSARGEQEKQRCLDLGAECFLSKTTPSTELVAVIKAGPPQ